MDCREIKEILEAYALGAAEPQEAAALEEHVADCLRCWEELNEAQRAAALLAFSVPLEEPPPSLRQALLHRAKREAEAAGRGTSLRAALRRLLPVGALALGAAGAAALGFALFLQAEMSDLQAEKDSLARQVQEAQARVVQQEEIITLLAAPDAQELVMAPASPRYDATAIYYWSSSSRKGFIVCNRLPRLGEGQVYQVWLWTEDGHVSAGTFESWDGTAQLLIDLSGMREPPTAIGITIEPTGGSEAPSGERILYAALPGGR